MYSVFGVFPAGMTVGPLRFGVREGWARRSISSVAMSCWEATSCQRL